MKRVKMTDAERQAGSDLLAVLSTPAGRRFMWNLIDDHSRSFSLDPYATAFQEGARSLRLDLAERCKAIAVEQYKAMVREQIDALTAPASTPEENETD